MKYFKIVKIVRFYICNEPLLIIIVVYDIMVDGNGCRTKGNRGMVEDVGDIVVCDWWPCEERIGHQNYDQKVGVRGV